MEKPTTILGWIGYSIVGLMAAFVLIGGPIIILATIIMLLLAECGIFGAAIIVAWLVAGVVCCCMYGMKKGLPKWIGGTAAAIVGSAFLFIVIGTPVALIHGMMQGSSSSEEYRPYKSVVDDVERQQAKFKYIGDGDGF